MKFIELIYLPCSSRLHFKVLSRLSVVNNNLFSDAHLSSHSDGAELAAAQARPFCRAEEALGAEIVVSTRVHAQILRFFSDLSHCLIIPQVFVVFDCSIAVALELQLQKELGTGWARPVLRQGGSKQGRMMNRKYCLAQDGVCFSLFHGKWL